jgi:stage IV sporulation protein FB
MNLLIPEPTPYDVSFRLVGTPVRISAGFWAVHLTLAVLFAAVGHWAWLVLWPACAFITVMVHEFGHVLTGRWFGSSGEIVLTPFGGLAGGAADLHKRMHRIAVYAAGPAAQLLLAGVLWVIYGQFIHDRLINHMVDQLVEGRAAEEVVRQTEVMFGLLMLICMNVGMPLFNLLPIPPLDGSKILEGFRSEDRPEWQQDPDWWKRG